MYCHQMSTVAISCHKLSNWLFNRLNARNLIHKGINRTKSNKRVIKPSVQNRLEVLDDKNEDNPTSEQWGELEESEADFMNVHMSHREHEREMAKRQHTTRVKILENKYFKQKQEPALLTWEERQQICYLHKSNPQKWNVRTLAASFPITESAIEKILKAKWRPINIERVNMYNKTVEKNWKMLYEGKLEISSEARDHLERFSSRKKIMLPPPDPDMVATSESSLQPTSKEFSDIVKSSKPTELLPDPAQSIRDSLTRSLHSAPDDETYVMDEDKRMKSRTLSTLDMYRRKILESSKSLDAFDKAIIDGYKSDLLKNHDSINQVSPSDFAVKKYDKRTVELESKASAIQEKIEIPPYLRKKGCLFKLDDCYYDEDGELLYRVPGMG